MSKHFSILMFTTASILCNNVVWAADETMKPITKEQYDNLVTWVDRANPVREANEASGQRNGINRWNILQTKEVLSKLDDKKIISLENDEDKKVLKGFLTVCRVANNIENNPAGALKDMKESQTKKIVLDGSYESNVRYDTNTKMLSGYSDSTPLEINLTDVINGCATLATIAGSNKPDIEMAEPTPSPTSTTRPLWKTEYIQLKNSIMTATPNIGRFQISATGLRQAQNIISKLTKNETIGLPEDRTDLYGFMTACQIAQGIQNKTTKLGDIYLEPAHIKQVYDGEIGTFVRYNSNTNELTGALSFKMDPENPGVFLIGSDGRRIIDETVRVPLDSLDAACKSLELKAFANQKPVTVHDPYLYGKPMIYSPPKHLAEFLDKSAWVSSKHSFVKPSFPGDDVGELTPKQVEELKQIATMGFQFSDMEWSNKPSLMYIGTIGGGDQATSFALAMGLDNRALLLKTADWKDYQDNPIIKPGFQYMWSTIAAFIPTRRLTTDSVEIRRPWTPEERARFINPLAAFNGMFDELNRILAQYADNRNYMYSLLNFALNAHLLSPVNPDAEIAELKETYNRDLAAVNRDEASLIEMHEKQDTYTYTVQQSLKRRFNEKREELKTKLDQDIPNTIAFLKKWKVMQTTLINAARNLRNAIIEQTPKHSGLVYRGSITSPLELALMAQKKRFYVPAFLSTSLSEDIAYQKERIIPSDMITDQTINVMYIIDTSEYPDQTTLIQKHQQTFDEQECLIACYNYYEYQGCEYNKEKHRLEVRLKLLKAPTKEIVVKDVIMPLVAGKGSYYGINKWIETDDKIIIEEDRAKFNTWLSKRGEVARTKRMSPRQLTNNTATLLDSMFRYNLLTAEEGKVKGIKKIETQNSISFRPENDAW